MLIVKLQHTGVIMTSVQNGQVGVQDYTMHNESEVKSNRNYDVWSDDWSNN